MRARPRPVREPISSVKLPDVAPGQVYRVGESASRDSAPDLALQQVPGEAVPLVNARTDRIYRSSTSGPASFRSLPAAAGVALVV